MKKTIVTLIFITLIFFTSACSQRQAEVLDTNTLVYGSSSDYNRLNPIFEEHGEINKLIFSGLVKYDKDRKVQMDIAETIKWNEDDNSYEITLKTGPTWQDGIPVESEDVKFTLEQILKPENGSEISSNYKDIEEIQVLNKKQLKIMMKKKNSAFLGYLSIGLIPKHILEGQDLTKTTYNKLPIGTGPYKVVDFKQGQYVELQRFDKYYSTKPTIKKVIFKIITDERTRALELKSGSIDLAQVGPMEVGIFENDNKFKVYKEKTSDYRGLLFNFKKPIFKSSKIRQAIAYSIDRQTIVNSVLKGYGEAAYSQLQRSEFNNETIERYSYNPEKSRKFIEEEGYTMTDGVYQKGGFKLSVQIVSPEGDEVRGNLSLAVAEYMRAIGIDASVKVAAYGSFSWDEIDAYLIGWGSPYDPDSHMYKVFHSEEGNGGNNLGTYKNPEVDEYLEKARQSFESSQRKVDYGKVLEILAQDPPFAMIAYIDSIYVASSRVNGMEDKLLGHHGVGFLDNIENWKVS